MHDTTAFSTRTLGFVAIGCILVWSAAQVITAMKVKMLYVDPEQQRYGEAGEMNGHGNETRHRKPGERPRRKAGPRAWISAGRCSAT